jgi:tellurite resistance protein
MTDKPTEQEDAYFRKQDMELRQKLRERLGEAASGLREDPKAAELSVQARIEALGFGGERVKVFDLLPLVHVAWADGSVSRQERATILELVRARGIEPGSDPFALMESLLEQRPPQEFLDQSLAVLRLAAGDARGESIVEMCVRIANASGGFMNIGKVSDDERRLIEKIASQLGGQAVAAFHRELG